MANRLTQRQLMVYVSRHYDYARQQGWAPAWPCPHCRASLTVLTCLYTPNIWATDETSHRPGDLCCPHCGQSVARALVRLLFQWDAPRHRRQQRWEAGDVVDDDEDEEC